MDNNTKIVTQKEFIFKVTDTKETKNEIQNSNTIDLRECEYKLKEKYNFSENKLLLIYMIDLVKDYATPKIKYLAYSQNKTQFVLKYYNDAKKLINTQKLDNFELNKDLINNGIDLYNQSDYFFNDRCNIKNINNSSKLLSLSKELFFKIIFFVEIIVNIIEFILVTVVKCNFDLKVKTNFKDKLF